MEFSECLELISVSALDATPRPVKRSDYLGRWLALIFYPRDFSFVCPTELTAFSARLAEFGERDCELLGISVDSIQHHQEWLRTPVAEGGLGPLQFPLASDPDGAAARAFGVWVEEKEVSTRGLFIIDPDGVLQYSVVHSLSVGRSPDEVLRVLDALQSGGLCPVSWTSADGTIDVEHALKPGRILGHYRIRTQLGGGTFGTVFAAWDLRLERMVALKVLKQNVFESRDAVLAEARAAAKLTHPNVCTVYGGRKRHSGVVSSLHDAVPLRSLSADQGNGNGPGRLQGREVILPRVSRSSTGRVGSGGEARLPDLRSTGLPSRVHPEHIPPKGAHLARYYGWYSNKSRGMRKKAEAEQGETAGKPSGGDDASGAARTRCTKTWAMLIKRVYEVDPMVCPNCGCRLRVAASIESHQDEVIEKILRHCGLWRTPAPRPPPDVECVVHELDGWFSDTPTGSCDQAGELTFVDMDTFLATF